MKKMILPLALVLVSLALSLGSPESRAKRASFLGQTVFYPFTRSINVFRSNSSLKRELASLQEQQAALTLENLRLNNVLKESQTLQAITFDTGGISFEVGEVIGYSGQFQQRNLVVNKGSVSGVEVNSPVVSAGGIVGRVISVSATNCVVLPFSNPRFQIPVMDKLTSVQGILQSDLAGKTNMNMIRLGSQISAGDTIVTSNLSTLYPKGYPVGKVSRIRDSQDQLFISAEIEPFTQVENLEHVFILKERHK